FALSYAFTGGRLGHDFALRVIAKNWFTRLCTGVDCYYLICLINYEQSKSVFEKLLGIKKIGSDQEGMV
ncbi:MAG: hypothetical protein ACK568_07280, partial [Pseudanabaena sp.]